MAKFTYKKHVLEPDATYGDILVAKFINHVMKEGKKSLAQRIVYKALLNIKEQTKKDPLEVFRSALENAAPIMEVRSKRVGGATYQVPVEVRGDRRMGLAMRWITTAAAAKKRKPLEEKLAEELLLAYKNEGIAVKKKEDMHRMAEANKAFAHFAW